MAFPIFMELPFYTEKSPFSPALSGTITIYFFGRMAYNEAMLKIKSNNTIKEF